MHSLKLLSEKYTQLICCSTNVDSARNIINRYLDVDASTKDMIILYIDTVVRDDLDYLENKVPTGDETVDDIIRSAIVYHGGNAEQTDARDEFYSDRARDVSTEYVIRTIYKDFVRWRRLQKLINKANQDSGINTDF